MNETNSQTSSYTLSIIFSHTLDYSNIDWHLRWKTAKSETINGKSSNSQHGIWLHFVVCVCGAMVAARGENINAYTR